MSRCLDQTLYTLDDYLIDPKFREDGDVADSELLGTVHRVLDRLRNPDS